MPDEQIEKGKTLAEHFKNNITNMIQTLLNQRDQVDNAIKHLEESLKALGLVPGELAYRMNVKVDITENPANKVDIVVPDKPAESDKPAEPDKPANSVEVASRAIDFNIHTLRDVILYALSENQEITSYDIEQFLNSIAYKTKAKRMSHSVMGTVSNLTRDGFVEQSGNLRGMKLWRLTNMGTARAVRLFLSDKIS